MHYLSFRFKDKLIDERIHHYYVRVTQEDGEQAWSSPVWVTRQKVMPAPPRGEQK